MARTSTAARRQPGSLKKAIFKKKVEKKQLRYLRRHEVSQPSLYQIASAAEVTSPLYYTSTTDNTMRSVMSLTESITRSDETVSCQQSTDRFLAGLFSPSGHQKNVESSKSEEVSHNLGLLFSLSPIPEEKTNQVASDKDVVSFGNLFASEQEKKQPALTKTSDEVISFGRLFSETSEKETTQSLGPLFSLPETSEQEVVTFGNLFASEKEATSSDEKSENTENLGPLFSLPVTSEQAVVTFGNLFATSPVSEQETSQPLGPLFSPPTTSEQEVVTFGNIFAEEQDDTKSPGDDVTQPVTVASEDLLYLLHPAPSDDGFELGNLEFRFDSDVDIDKGHRVCVYAPTVGVRSEYDLSSAASKSEETISLGHFFSEGSEHDITQVDSASLSTVSDQKGITTGNNISSEKPIIIFPDSSDEYFESSEEHTSITTAYSIRSADSDEILCYPSPKDSLELSYVKNLNRISETDVIYSILSEESSIRAIVRERYQENSDVSTTTTTDEEMIVKTPKDPRHRLSKKKTKDISTKDRVSALEMEVHELRDEVENKNNLIDALKMEVDQLRDEADNNNSRLNSLENSLEVLLLAEALRRQQNNTEASTKKTEDVPPAPSVRQRAAFFDSKSDTAVDVKQSAEISIRETRTV